MNITTKILEEQYIRVSRDWAVREGLDYNRVIFRHRDRKSLIVALQLPELRKAGDNQDFIMRLDAMEAYYQYEQQGKSARRNGNGDLTRQIWLMGVSETFKYNHYDYPKQSEILCDGVMETLENIRTRALSLKDRLRVYQSRDGDIFFIDTDWRPISYVGVDPDEPRPRRSRSVEDDTPRPSRRRALSVDVLITDGVSDDVTLRFPGVTLDQVVEALEDKFGRPESDEKLPF